MNKIINSKLAAWCALVLIVLVIILTFRVREEWWQFIDIFFAFMMIFTHLFSLYLKRLIGRAAATLDRCALIFGICFLISFIIEFIILNS